MIIAVKNSLSIVPTFRITNVLTRDFSCPFEEMVLEVNLKNAAMLPVGVGVGYRKLGLALEFSSLE